MKNPKHTPGPWTLGNENNECCEVILGTEHNLVCSLDRQDLNTSKVVISRDEMLANAHLIIAAPQMLEALKAAQAMFAKDHVIAQFSWKDSNLRAEDFAELNDVPLKLRAAIKLAEGE